MTSGLVARFPCCLDDVLRIRHKVIMMSADFYFAISTETFPFDEPEMATGWSH